jgi:hypothetical protein
VSPPENQFESRFGQLLYELLPAVYRERDNTERDRLTRAVSSLGDLARYLDGLGLLLDRVRATLDQRLADAFPDNPAAGRACQEWLIPYFARLLDVRLVSPTLEGQRDEVFHAVRWRQAKGTLQAVEEISEAVTRQEVELQEGWRRVAQTARVGWPLLPPSVYGVQLALDPRWPSRVTKHPGLPAVTIDFRCPSQAVNTRVVSPAVKTSRLGGVAQRWMQANPHGVPEGPGSFDDVSRRTADLRTPPDHARGHAHPRRLLAYTAVPFGLFPPAPVTLTLAEAAGSPLVAWIVDQGRRELTVRNISDRPVIVSGDATLPPTGLDVDRVTIDGLRFAGKLAMTRGRLALRRVVAGEVSVATHLQVPETPVLAAADSLFGKLDVSHGYARFERCTVRGDAACGSLLADDSIFAAALTLGADGAGRVSHCRLPPGLTSSGADAPFVIDESCKREVPEFLASAFDHGGALDPAAGVLSPDCPAVILFGAGDGGEMGVYHDGRQGGPVVVTQPQVLALAQADLYVLRDLVFAGRLEVAVGVQQPLRLERVAAADLRLHPEPRPGPHQAPPLVLEAKSALFGAVTVDVGLARLEFCTVLGAASFGPVQASDCLFTGTLAGGGSSGGLTRADCVRYSRVPPALLAAASPGGGLAVTTCTGAPPVFFERDFARAAAGHPGGGVLHPATPAAVCAGAEDGGELGAYHEARHCLGRQALLDKLAEHLPVGMEPVLIPDLRLHLTPPAATERTKQP